MAKIYSSFIEQTFSYPNNQGQFRVEVVNVPTAGTPVQLSNIPINPGVELVLRARTTLLGRMYIANSSANCADATKRMELRNGESVGLTVDNSNLIYIDSSTNNGKIELFVEA